MFSEKHTLFSSHKCPFFPLHRITHYTLFSEKHIISSISLYPNLTNTHYMLSSDKHIHSLNRNAILLSDKHNKSFSEISHWYIIFSDRHSVSSFEIYKLHPSHTPTQIHISAKLTVSISRINTL